MKLTKDLVEKYCHYQSYTKGLSYYKKGKVQSMDVEIEGETEEDFFVAIYGTVEGSDYEYYEVEVNFSARKGFTFFGCECPAFFSYNGGERFCKHIAAVLLKYLNEYSPEQFSTKNKAKPSSSKQALNKKITPFPRLPSIAENLANSMAAGFIKQEDTRQEVVLEPTLYVNYYYGLNLYLEFKTGIERLYVVRNLGDFIETSFKKKVSYEFGKNFTFNPAQHKYNSTDEKLLDIIVELYEADKISSTYFDSYGSHSLIRGRQAIITQSILKRIFEIYEGKSILISYQGREAKPYQIKPENLPLSFSMSLKNNEIALDLNSEAPFPLISNGSYFIYMDSVYKPSDEQLNVYIPIYNASLERGGHISFPPEDKEIVASLILPSLRKISNDVKLDKSLESQIIEEPLIIKAYLDKYEKGISLKFQFNYGDITDKDKIILRDVERETRALHFASSCGFMQDNGIFYLNDEEKIVEFIENKLSYLQEIAEVYYSDSFKTVKVYSKSSFKSRVRLNDSDFLEFSFSIDGVDKSELAGILQSLRQRKKYHKLKNGGFIPLESDEIKDLAGMIEYLDIKDQEFIKDKMLLSKYHAVYMDQVIKSGNLNFIERDKRFRELVSNIREIQETDFEPPLHLQNVLRGYQRAGFKWFKTLSSYGFGGILADEMGLGKTLQAISFIESEKNESKDNKKPSLVICPTSLVYNWKAEIERFAPSLSTVVISGSKSERLQKRNEIEAADVVITSYPLIRRDIEEYRDIEFSCCILDEAQQIKNPASQNARSVKEIRAKNRFAMTGTPIENSLTELWSIFDFLMPGYLLSHKNFSAKYETPISRDKDSRALLQLNRHIKPFILRRLKKDVVKELPPKIEQTILVEMTESQKKLYLAYLEAARKDIDKDFAELGFNKSRIKMIAALTRLRQICCDPSSFLENYEGESGKISALLELLDESIEGGHRILLFSQFTSVLKNIGEKLKENDIDYMYLDGSTKSEKRIDMVNRFNSGEGSVFLISLKAGGTGLNLFSADVVIHFDPWWNPAVEAQAEDRAHRIGQSKTVEVMKLVSIGTVEEKILKLQEKKREIASSVIGSSSDEESFISTLSREELQELFMV